MKKILFVISIAISQLCYGQTAWNAANGQITYTGGNVGIGTNSPENLLHIDSETQSNILVKIGDKRNSGGPLLLGARVTSTEDIGTYHRGGFIIYQTGGNSTNHVRRLNIGAREWSDSWNGGSQISFWTSPVNSGNGWDTAVERLTITRDGQVGIGTTSPDSKLTVAGNIHAQEVKVTIDAGTGPDYVFESDYNLRTLEETEAYIKSNKHLPEVPSAKEMEANGVQLGEMNMLLLKKIEELTLHTIQQQKLIEAQGKMIVELKEKLK